MTENKGHIKIELISNGDGCKVSTEMEGTQLEMTKMLAAWFHSMYEKDMGRELLDDVISVYENVIKKEDDGGNISILFE